MVIRVPLALVRTCPISRQRKEDLLVARVAHLNWAFPVQELRTIPFGNTVVFKSDYHRAQLETCLFRKHTMH